MKIYHWWPHSHCRVCIGNNIFDTSHYLAKQILPVEIFLQKGSKILWHCPFKVWSFTIINRFYVKVRHTQKLALGILYHGRFFEIPITSPLTKKISWVGERESGFHCTVLCCVHTLHSEQCTAYSAHLPGGGEFCEIAHKEPVQNKVGQRNVGAVRPLILNNF